MPAPGSSTTRSRYHVNAIERGLTILSRFDQERIQLSLTEIASGLDCALSSALRLLRTLEDLGFVVQDIETGNYRPGIAAIRLGYASIVSSPLHTCSLPVLAELHRQLSVNVSLDVLVGDRVCRVERLSVINLLPDELTVGSFFPAHNTAAGRALLMGLPVRTVRAVLAKQDFEPRTEKTLRDAKSVEAELRRARARGYACSDQEFSVHLRAVAAPVQARDGTATAAVTISSASHAVPAEIMHGVHAPAAIAAAARIAAALAELEGRP